MVLVLLKEELLRLSARMSYLEHIYLFLAPVFVLFISMFRESLGNVIHIPISLAIVFQSYLFHLPYPQLSYLSISSMCILFRLFFPPSHLSMPSIASFIFSLYILLSIHPSIHPSWSPHLPILDNSFPAC